MQTFQLSLLIENRDDYAIAISELEKYNCRYRSSFTQGLSFIQGKTG